ncbi:ABC transporter sub-family G-like protein 12 [Sarcoptes scabiei]|uniref:ABC transporter sub-family G-like protein 12 n=1 Tax=Sarcoptes scabiei TaxID=52283 RepID=A0A132A6T5_SARSC|nr:ABC transporter sub-family G-like protein 12 [Sarcoptes scabiei]
MTMMTRNVSPADTNETITMPHALELVGVCHSGPIAPNRSSLWSKMTYYPPTGLILKDISFEIHSGEMMAILGSKGSGKKALLELISHRINHQSTTRGQILLNDVPLTLRVFQEQCAFVSKRTELIEGLSVRQTLTYMAKMTIHQPIPRRLPDGSFMTIRFRVKQVMADTALTSLANLDVSELNEAERRRLSIAMHLIRDALLLVLDNPTSNLSPLDSYFIVSMLSNHCRKYQRILLFTIDNPRSDIFPFIDRVTFLSLGEIVYTGSTRMMMDYFSGIGFPCPELENPLMYYLCLSTVDRRSRERFIESSAQIAALVDKFKIDGQEYRKYNSPYVKLNYALSIPLTAYGKASTCTTILVLIARQFCSNLIWKRLFLKIGFIPLFCTLLYSFILPSLSETQNSFQTRSAIIFNLFASITFLTPIITSYCFYQHRNRFYEDSSRLSIYRGPSLIVTNILANLPMSLLQIITYWTTAFRIDEYWLERWIVFCSVLWGLYTFVEQLTIGLMCFVRSSFNASLSASYFLTPFLIMGSTSFRSMLASPNILYYINWLNIYYWAGWTLHFIEFQFNTDLVRVPHVSTNNTVELCSSNVVPGKCMFLSGNHYLDQRFRDIKDIPEWSLIFWKNFAFIFIFAIGAYLINTVIYVIPLPASLKSKFRD